VDLCSDPIEQQLEISEYLGDRIAVSVCNRSNFLSSPSMFVSLRKSTEFHSTADLHSTLARTELALGLVVYVL
jgi:hypothetical protein